MNWIEFIKTNWQYIVPVIGFLGAVFMYVAHDRKLKNLQIKQLKEEQDKKNRLILSVMLIEANQILLLKLSMLDLLTHQMCGLR